MKHGTEFDSVQMKRSDRLLKQERHETIIINQSIANKDFLFLHLIF